MSQENGHPESINGKEGGIHPTSLDPRPSARPAKPSGVEGSLVLSAFEERTIQCFVEIASGFHLPRSLGEIFGLIYASPEPVPFDGVMQRLKLSKASTSTGLKFLQRLGAVKTVYVGGDRRTFYEPETSIRRMIAGLMNETVLPHLRNSKDHIHRMEELLSDVESHPRVLNERVRKLTRWQSKADTVLPMILKLGSLKE